ncbi:uncharacterized protein LOC116293198 [Actinia tenebrosa]|uniref:Uncharacterized protein LOC116293198 n=1 Tax=Actinia tenebrosa TaxID=6105 RepID=A0A6P8HV39_ACTTE|nr:uncharacterized protein LOC116293198 [Actinia tenebrosa]
MELKWIVVFLGAFALIHLTIGEEEIPEIEEVEEVKEHVRVRRQSICTDKLDYCQSWPDKYCQDYKDYMKTNCPKKCGYCSGPTQARKCKAITNNSSSLLALGGYLIARGNSRQKAQLLLPLEIVLPHQDTATTTMCLRFQHSVSSGGSLKVYEIQNKKGQPSRVLKTISGGSNTNWQCGTQTVKVSTLYQILIEATVGSGPVALDAISFARGSC